MYPATWRGLNTETLSVLLVICEGIYRLRIPPKYDPLCEAVMFTLLLVNMLLKRLYSCRWFETPWCSHDFSVMANDVSQRFGEVARIECLVFPARILDSFVFS